MPFANNNDIRIHYETVGDGPPLVLLHPYPGWLEGWIDTGYVDAFKNDYLLVLIDQRGFGVSDKPHEPDAYGLQARTADVVAVLDDLGIDQAHMWGYSMGARIVWGLAHYCPERCRSLIIGADFPYEPDPAEPLPEFLQGQIETLQHGQMAFVSAMLGMFAPWLKAGWDWEERLGSTDLEALLAFRSNRERVGLLDSLPGLDIPCLLYAGDQDPMLRYLERWVQRLQRASLVALPNVNHLQGFFERDLVVPHAKAFLRGV